MMKQFKAFSKSLGVCILLFFAACQQINEPVIPSHLIEGLAPSAYQTWYEKAQASKGQVKSKDQALFAQDIPLNYQSFQPQWGQMRSYGNAQGSVLAVPLQRAVEVRYFVPTTVHLLIYLDQAQTIREGFIVEYYSANEFEEAEVLSDIIAQRNEKLTGSLLVYNPAYEFLVGRTYGAKEQAIRPVVLRPGQTELNATKKAQRKCGGSSEDKKIDEGEGEDEEEEPDPIDGPPIALKVHLVQTHHCFPPPIPLPEFPDFPDRPGGSGGKGGGGNRGGGTEPDGGTPVDGPVGEFDEEYLSRAQLQNDPRFKPLKADYIRREIARRRKSWPPWQVNIGSGSILERAFQRWNRAPHNGQSFNTTLRPTKVKPDFVGDVVANGRTYPNAVSEEVKVTVGTIDGSFSKGQIGGEIQAVSVQGAPDWAATFRLIVPEGTKINIADLKKIANRYKVRLFISYAFLREDNGHFYFSKPEFINWDSVPPNSFSDIFDPGWHPRGVPVDWENWLPKFKESNEYYEYLNGAPTE